MKRRRLKLALLFMVAAYLLTYVVLSRSGQAEARQWNAEGFYYFTPEDTSRWRFMNSACRVVFAPLNAIDCWMGLGSAAARDPLFRVVP